MFAIPVRELERERVSLMDLSRWDNTDQRTSNIKHYSLGDKPNERRAHWSPGVGPWQLDEFETAQNLNHAERANANRAAQLVAEHVFPGLCGEESLRSVLDSWHACEGKVRLKEDPNVDYCPPLATKIYDTERDSLWIEPVSGSDVDGGVQDRRCRWDLDGDVFNCYLFDVANAEGDPTIYHPNGNADDTATPLPAPFISFTDPDDGTKYAAFPADLSDYDATLIRAVEKDQFSRESTLGDGSGWFVGTVEGRALHVEDCESAGPPATLVCVWVRQ